MDSADFDASKKTDLPDTSRIDAASALLRATRYCSRLRYGGNALRTKSRISSRAILPMEPLSTRCAKGPFPRRILVSKNPGSNEKPLAVIPEATLCQNEQFRIRWVQEQM